MLHYISNIRPDKNSVNRVHEAIKTLPEKFQLWFMIFRAPMPQTFESGDVYDYEAARKAGYWSLACMEATPKDILEQFDRAWTDIVLSATDEP